MEQQQPRPAANPNDVPGEIDFNPGVILEKLDTWLDGFARLIPNILVGIVVLVIFIFIARLVARLLRKSLLATGRENLGDVAGGFVKWIIYGVGFLLAATVIIPTLNPGDLIAGLGVSSVAIGFAFKDILQNWLAGLLILLRQPFQVGDEIEINGFVGSVERIETRATIIRQYNAVRVVVPNSEIYTNSVKVITANKLIRDQYDVGIGYGDNIEEAKEVIRKAAVAIEGVDNEKGVEALTWGLDASWVTIRVRWWVDSRRKSVVHVQDEVLIAVKEALDAAHIDMPYQTLVNLLHDQTEATDGDRTTQREGWPVPRDGQAPQPRWKVRDGNDQNGATNGSAEGAMEVDSTPAAK
ncbi:mechanosensitive ion channel family protein [Neolewinella antarctica]|uniref:Small-conductance mechanosensitive channel n=1 Tax=Neolewinella antarctica TaxID=442734 RepID=A0ABX0XAM8_9BACT|nr:mechanosensitive ion channel family protein [Neolewinella antarctica]NJC26295.1 small-conductance mechanosensitive channel [Neolewinella antarctica]